MQSQPNQIIKKETLYTGTHDLGNGMYSVEILLSQMDDLVISAQHSDLPDSFIIDIENMKVNHLISEFQNDFEVMASHLKIMNKRMVLLNPVSFYLTLILCRNSSPKCKMKMAKRIRSMNWGQTTQTSRRLITTRLKRT